MLPECSQCIYSDKCTPSEKQLENINMYCDNFIDIEFDCLSNGFAEWKEMSYNKYADNILDYGEMSEWDIFMEEKSNR
jgi:hypothetical protein